MADSLQSQYAYVEIQQGTDGLSRGVCFFNQGSNVWKVWYTTEGWKSLGYTAGDGSLPDQPEDARPFCVRDVNGESGPPGWVSEYHVVFPANGTYVANLIAFDKAGSDIQDFYMFLWGTAWENLVLLMLAKVNISRADDIDPYYTLSQGTDTPYGGPGGYASCCGTDSWTGSGWIDKTIAARGNWRMLPFSGNANSLSVPASDQATGPDVHGMYNPLKVTLLRSTVYSYSCTKGVLASVMWNAPLFASGTALSTDLTPPPIMDWVVFNKVILPWSGNSTQPICLPPP